MTRLYRMGWTAAWNGVPYTHCNMWLNSEGWRAGWKAGRAALASAAAAGG